MKHLIPLLLLTMVCYVAWNIAPKDARHAALAFLGRHAIFLVVVAVVFIGLLSAAVNFNSIHIL